MYTASGGYYLDGSSFTRKKLKSHKISRIPTLYLTIFLTLFIFSFIFGAVLHANATSEDSLTEESLTVQSESTVLYETHIVDTGQSLWSIAKIFTPEHMDIREYVIEIQLLNQLDSNVLFQGQRLLLPTIS